MIVIKTRQNGKMGERTESKRNQNQNDELNRRTTKTRDKNWVCCTLVLWMTWCAKLPIKNCEPTIQIALSYANSPWLIKWRLRLNWKPTVSTNPINSTCSYPPCWNYVLYCWMILVKLCATSYCRANDICTDWTSEVPSKDCCHANKLNL